MTKKPLSTEEVQAAADRFFPLFDVILSNMPEGSKTEDSLKVMETVCNLAHKMREDTEVKSSPLGFNKNKEHGTTEPN
jgi:hypothetical protein